MTIAPTVFKALPVPGRSKHSYRQVAGVWQQIAANPTPHLVDIMGQHLSSERQNRFGVKMELERNAMMRTAVIDYGLTTYSQQHLPQLIEAIRPQDSWTEIVPELFGVSVATFEQGWHASLASR